MEASERARAFNARLRHPFAGTELAGLFTVLPSGFPSPKTADISKFAQCQHPLLDDISREPFAGHAKLPKRCMHKTLTHVFVHPGLHSQGPASSAECLGGRTPVPVTGGWD